MSYSNLNMNISSDYLVLVVDDNPANLDVLSAYLQNDGFRVETTLNSKTAIELIHKSKPNIVLLDAMMPVVDGFELCKIIKDNKQTSDIPVIFITALNQPEELVKAFNHGAVDYLSKPFSKDELLSRVKNHLRIVDQTNTIKKQNQDLITLNEEKNSIIELTAHDLKNPLQSIIGFSELLISKLPEDEQNLLSYVHSIKSSAQKAVNIIKDLNEVNLIEEGKLSLSILNFDLRDIVMKVIEDYLYLAESKKQIIIYNEIEEELIIHSDKSKLARIFDNLISNSIKFSDKGKKIFIECKKENSSAVVVIRDQGPGFTADDKSKLFGKFSKLSARPTADEPSTGLGLSIVKKLTDLLGGNIELKSEYNEGAEFIFRFPLVQK